jgi:hypothetical protein
MLAALSSSTAFRAKGPGSFSPARRAGLEAGNQNPAPPRGRDNERPGYISVLL